MSAIIKKDVRSYFNTFTGWLFIGLLWMFLSFFISYYNFFSLSSDMSAALSVIVLILLILIPILSMRSFADEQKQKTDQLLFTAPVSVGKVVLGKFFALAAVYSIPMLFLCFVPPILGRFGTVSYGLAYTGIFGLWLLGLVCIAICIFASSLTESPVIAAVIGFAILFGIYMIPQLKSMISSGENTATKALSTLSAIDRYYTFLGGTLDVSAIIYLVTAVALFLFLTVQVIQKRRYAVSKKTIKFSAFSSAMVVILIVATVLINMAASQLPSSLRNIDLTPQRIFSVTDDTKKIVSAIGEDVNIYVLAAESKADKNLNKTLEKYQALSDHIKVKYVDPAANPTFLKDYTTSTDIYVNSLVVESSKRYRVINYSDIYKKEMDSRTYTQKTTGYDGEGRITSALMYVTNDKMPAVYTLTGHGEAVLGSRFSDALQKLNISSKALDFMKNDAVPEDAAAVVIYAPTSDISSDELTKLKSYIDGGGGIVAVTTAEAAADMTNYKALLEYYGVTLGEGIVMDDNSGNYYNYPNYLLPRIASDDITSQIRNGYVLSVFSQALTADESRTDVKFTKLLSTSDKGYIHAKADDEGDLARTDDDESAERIIGLKAVRTGDSGSSTLVAYTSPYIFVDQADQIVSGSNVLLFKGTMGAVAGSDIETVSIPVKEYGSSELTMSARTAAVFGVMTTLAVPIVLIVAGLFIWLVRRKK